MYYLQSHQIIKYLIMAIILILLLRYIPTSELSWETIITIVVSYLVILFIVEKFIDLNREGMTDFSQGGEGIATAYNMNNQNDYYPFNENAQLPQGGIPYSMAPELITDSKLDTLYQQHNFNILWSPHTHFGKARGYMNWEKTYDE